jgi:hypothetical protein
MSDEEQRKEVFAWFGAASYYAQCVEVELWIARLVLVRKDDREPTDPEWQRLESEKLTMNGLLRLVQKGIELETAEMEALEICRKKRNWLAHDYWMERSHLLVSSEGCTQAVDELANLCEIFKRGDEVARGVSTRIRARLGISEHLVQELQDEYVQRLRAGESHEAILQDQEKRMKELSARIAGTQARNGEQERRLDPKG